MTPLIITPELRLLAQEIKAYALAHPYNMAQMLSAAHGKPIRQEAGEDPNSVMLIPTNFRLVYSVEEQPCGRCHHISMSIPEQAQNVTDKDFRFPSPDAMAVVCKDLFDIKTPITQAAAQWIEDGAVNLIFLFNDTNIRTFPR